MNLTNLSDDELLISLSRVCDEEHRLLARLLVHLIAVEDRKLALKAAFPTIYKFCETRLGMSETAAFRRINAARLVRKFPSLLPRIERGEIHLSALQILRDVLTAENVEELAAMASGKSKSQLEEIVARLRPRPDVPATIQPLPQSQPALLPSEAMPTKPAPPARIEALAPERYRVELTVGAELRAKIERARDLMAHRNPSGDLEIVFHSALDALIAKLEKERLAKVDRPRATTSSSQEGHVSAATRRAVFARDGERCTYEDADGNRCPATKLLELDHVIPRPAEERTTSIICAFGVVHITSFTPRRFSVASTSRLGSSCAGATQP
jgi:hypothetical protein